MRKQTEAVSIDFGKSIRYFPYVGVLIGCILCMTYDFFYMLTQNLRLSVLITLAFQVYLTGALHYDGFMDSMDALFSHRSVEDRLQIMKDSRIGSYAAMGVLFLVLLKWEVLSSMPFIYGMMALFLVEVINKIGLAMSIFHFRYARKQGLGELFSTFCIEDVKWMYGHAILCLLAILSVCLYFHLFYIFWGAILVTICHLSMQMFINLRVQCAIGGLTGDTYGFSHEIAALFSYFVMYVYFI